MQTVAIIDYGSGNLHSAAKAFERAARDSATETRVLVTSRAKDVATADRIVLPGVGAFAECKAGLMAVPGLRETLEDAVRASEQVIDGYLLGMSEPEMAAADLFSKFEDFGEVPFIFRDGDGTLNVISFNYYKYAITRCGSICGRKEGVRLTESAA